MGYATLADVTAAVGGSVRLTQLADHDGGVAANVIDAVAEADGIIDSYANKRFRVPFAVVPVTISKLSARWAARVLHRNAGQVLAEHVTGEESDTKWLEALARGDVSPGVDPNPEKASIMIDKAAPRDATIAISRERLKGFA